MRKTPLEERACAPVVSERVSIMIHSVGKGGLYTPPMGVAAVVMSLRGILRVGALSTGLFRLPIIMLRSGRRI